MAKAQIVNYQSVQHDLGQALRSLRSDCPPMETARELLSYDQDEQPLVGIRYDGERVVYFQESNRQAIAVRLAADGLSKDGGLLIAKLSHEMGLEAWVEKMQHYWGWRRPKYR